MEPSTDAQTAHGRVIFMHIDVVSGLDGIHCETSDAGRMIRLHLPQVSDHLRSSSAVWLWNGGTSWGIANEVHRPGFQMNATCALHTDVMQQCSGQGRVIKAGHECEER